MARSKNRSPITRSGARRLGDDYQDLVALDILVDWLEHSSRYRWVTLEADNVGALDDITALTSNDIFEVRQVKFSTSAEAEHDHLTWEMVLKRERSSSGDAKTSWLQKWGFSLAGLKSGQQVDAALVSNRRPAEEFQAALRHNRTVDYERVPNPVRQEIVEQLVGEEQARSFFATFRFILNQFLTFVRDLPDHADHAPKMKKRALAWLKSVADDHWQWAYTWLLAADLGDEKPLLDGPDRRWTVAAISKWRPEPQVSTILERAIQIALQCRDLPRAIRLSLLLGYYNETQMEYQEAWPTLLFTRLRLDEDNGIRPVLASRIRELGNGAIQLLAEAEGRVGNLEAVRRCFEEVRSRILHKPRTKTSMSSSSASSAIDTLLTIAAQPGGPGPNWGLTLAVNNREQGYSAHILKILSEQFRRRKDAAGLRGLLSPLKPLDPSHLVEVPELTHEERVEVIGPLIMLALEDSLNCDDLVRVYSAQPLALIYAAVRKTNDFVPRDFAFPDTNILDLRQYGHYERQKDEADFFVRTFFALLANYLWGKAEQNVKWLASVATFSWPRQFVQHLGEMARTMAERLGSGRPTRIATIYSDLAKFAPPGFRGNENWPEYNYGLAAGKAAIDLSFDLQVLLKSCGGGNTIDMEDLQAILSSGYCKKELWTTAYIERRRWILSPDAVNYLLAEGEANLASSSGYFSERATSYANLAAVAAMHGRPEKAEELLNLSANNLLTHGYHKDILIHNVLDSISAFHSGGKNLNDSRENAEQCLLKLAPPIAQVREYTDGDETRHLPRKLVSVLREVSPALLPAYYQWLDRKEEYYNALYAFEEFLRCADLSDPIVQAIARTGVEEESIQALTERAAKDDSGARTILAVLVENLGDGILRGSKESMAVTSEANPVSILGGESPSPEMFPPDRLLAYIDAARNGTSGNIEAAIKKWIMYWSKQPQRENAFKALCSAHERGISIRAFDELYEFAVEVIGRTQAYTWLEIANHRDYGWSAFYTDERHCTRRWEILKAHYPLRWFEFLQHTILNGGQRGRRFIAHRSYSRTIKYLMYFDQHELAFRTLKEMVEGCGRR